MISRCCKAKVVKCEGSAWDVKKVRAGATYHYGCTKCKKACDVEQALNDIKENK